MRELPRFVSKQLGRLISERTLFKIRTPVFHPFYHVVSDKNLAHILNYPYRTTTIFEKELDYFLRHFQPVSLEYIYNNPLPEKNVFHLSFDDGLSECADIIAPILLRKGIPATFFINSGFVDNKDLFHRYKASLILDKLHNEKNPEAKNLLKSHKVNPEELLQVPAERNNLLDEVANIIGLNFAEFLKSQKPYLSTKQVLHLKEQGFSIGGHSHTHRELYNLTEDEQFQEIEKSMDWLTKTINPKIKVFSFPFTDSGIAENVLKRLFSENVCDMTFGTAGLKYDELKNHFQRYPVEKAGDFKLNLKSEYVYFLLRKMIGKATVKH